MKLIIYFMILTIVFNALTYFVGLGVEAMWGSAASLLVALSLYFSTIWLAWWLAVRWSEPTIAKSAAL